MKLIYKIPALVKTFGINIQNMSHGPLELMKYGTMAITLFIAAFSIYLFCTYVFPGIVPGTDYFYLVKLAGAFYSGALFSLCVIWGGAFFIDYSGKQNG